MKHPFPLSPTRRLRCRPWPALLALWLLAPLLPALAQAQCAPAVASSSSNIRQTFAVRTRQSFTATCTGILQNVTFVIPNSSDDLRYSGYSIRCNLKDAAGTILGSSTQTDDVYPGKTYVASLTAANITLVSGTQYSWELENSGYPSGQGPIDLFLLYRTNVTTAAGDIYAGGSYTDDNTGNTSGDGYTTAVNYPYSDARGWTVNIGLPGPTITAQPQSASVCQGSAASLSVTATAPVTAYQWYSNTSNSNTGGTAISGATAATYVPATSTAGTRYYYVQVYNSSGYTASSVAAVTVNAVPNAPTGAASQSFSSGAIVANLAATGSNIQWYATSTGGSPLPFSTALTNGTTYYGSQTVSGCESSSRLAVTATITTPATAPTVSTTAPASITSTSATLGGNVTADGGATVSDRGVVYVAGTGTPAIGGTGVTKASPATATGTGSYTVATTGLAPGTTYTMRAYATNSAGTSYGSSVSFTTSQAATAAPVVTAPANGSLLNTATPTYTGTAPAGSTVTVFVDGTSIGTTTATGGSFSLTQPTALAQGSHPVYATAQSSGSTASPTSNTNTFTVDTVAPTATISSTAGASGGSTSTSPVPFTVTFSEPVTGFSTSGITASGGAVTGFNGSGTTYNVLVTASGAGVVSLSVVANQAQDAVGNGNLATGPFSLTYTPAPMALTISTGTVAAPVSIAAGTYTTITVTATGYAQLGGAVTVDASYVYNNNGANTAQSTGNGLPAQVRNLTIANTAATNQTSATSVAQILTMAGSGSFNTLAGAGQFTLLSTATQTALIAQVGTGFTGQMTVQRYVDGSLNSGLGYRHFSSPVNGATMATLANGTFAPTYNTAYNTSPTPAAVTPFPTVFGYDQSRLASTSNNLPDFDKGWFSPAAATDALSIFRGYTLNLAAGQTLSLYGTVQGGGGILFSSLQRGPATDAGWQLLGNPFASPLDFSRIPASRRPNLEGAIYVVQSTGQYTGGYRSYVNGVGGNPVLPLGQAFFIRVNAAGATGSLTLLNVDRVQTLDYTPFQRTAASQRPLVQLDLRGQGLADAFYAYAEAGATAGFDGEYDAAKLPNSHGLNLSTARGTGEPLAIDGRADFTAATTFPLAVGVPAAGTYTLVAAQLANLPAGLTAYLRDAQAGTITALASGTGYTFSVTAAQATALLTGRFTLQFTSSALATAPAALAAQVSLYPNPAHDHTTLAVPGLAGTSQVQVQVLNALGQVVLRQQAALPAAGTSLTLPTGQLASGVYVVRLTLGQTTLTKRLTID